MLMKQDAVVRFFPLLIYANAHKTRRPRTPYTRMQGGKLGLLFSNPSYPGDDIIMSFETSI